MSTAKDVLYKILNFHPDMTPRQMKDGNVTLQYRHPAINVVLTAFAKSHWADIDQHHLDALATSEVLITPLGPNKFDEFGKLALYGRCYMFMDAQDPEVMQVVRATG